MFLAAVAFYWAIAGPWWAFAAAFLLPDLAILAYLGNPRTGAIVYNLVHTLLGPLALVVIAAALAARGPGLIALIATPLIIQSYGIFAVAYGIAAAWKIPFNVAAPCALIGTSNFFELAVAVAISLFGLNSGAALTTVVGVLVEVPVMLSLVAFANRTRNLFPAAQ